MSRAEQIPHDVEALMMQLEQLVSKMPHSSEAKKDKIETEVEKLAMSLTDYMQDIFVMCEDCEQEISSKDIKIFRYMGDLGRKSTPQFCLECATDSSE